MHVPWLFCMAVHWNTVCSMKQMYVCTSMRRGATASMLHGCVCSNAYSNAYLWSGSRTLCTRWDSRSKHWKMNYDIFLHSDRLDYRLQT